jgi:hypothetical protein
MLMISFFLKFKVYIINDHIKNLEPFHVVNPGAALAAGLRVQDGFH